jgi:hypothetical protein
MAVLEAQYWSARVVEADAISRDNVMLFEVMFTVAGAYAQLDGCRLSNVLATIKARQNVPYAVMSMIDVMVGRPGTRNDGSGRILGVENVEISGNHVTFHITDNDYSTEIADGPLPTQSRPFAFLMMAKMATTTVVP